MRWLVTLQMAVGLGALFGLGYVAVDRYLGPESEALARRAAEAEARAVAAEIDAEWDQARHAQQVVGDALADSPTFRALDGRMSANERARATRMAVESAVAQIGGHGKAAFIDRDGAVTAVDEDARALGELPEVERARKGGAWSGLARMGAQVWLVVATPVSAASNSSALVLATPLDDQLLRRWTQMLPLGSAAALVFDRKVLASTLGGPVPDLAAGSEELVMDGQRYVTARRELAASGGGRLWVVGLGRHGAIGARNAATQHTRLFIVILGGFAFLVVALVTMLAPAGGPVAPKDMDPSVTVDVPEARVPTEVAPVPELSFKFPSGGPAEAGASPGSPGAALAARAPDRKAEGPAPAAWPDAPFASAGARRAPPMPQEPLDPIAPPPFIPPAAEHEPTISTQFGRKTLPSVPAPEAPADPNSSFDALFQDPASTTAAPFSRPSAAPSFSRPDPGREHSAPPSGARSPFAPSGAAKPQSQAFDAIANAAMSYPPAVSRAPAPVADDLLAPKGGVPAELAAPEWETPSHRASFDPNLPVPKGPPRSYPPGSFGGFRERTPPPPTAPPPPPMAPPPPSRKPQSGSAPSYSGSPAIPLPGRTSGYSAPSHDPWQNPSIPEMAVVKRTDTVPTPMPDSHPAYSSSGASGYPVPAPASDPPGFSSPPSEGPAPFDEGHYRTVYNEFVASKARLGEAVDSLTYEGFSTKLRSSERALLDRHQCRAVRFQVLVKDRTVSLRPQLVR